MLKINLTENENSIVWALVAAFHDSIVDELEIDESVPLDKMVEQLDKLIENLVLLQHTESILDKLQEVE